MTLNIGVSVQGDVSKLQALDRQMKQLNRTYQELAQNAKRAGSAFSASLGPQMPLAGGLVPPTAVMTSPSAAHMGMAGSKMPPVMWGPGFRAQMHQMMPGQMTHQYGAASALTQLSNQHKGMAGASYYSGPAAYGTGNELRQLTTALTALTHALKQPASGTAAFARNPASNMNPWLSLQSQSTVLSAMNPLGATINSNVPGFANVNYGALSVSTRNRMTAGQVLLQQAPSVVNSTQPARSSMLRRVASAGLRTLGVPYEATSLGESLAGGMAGGAAGDALLGGLAGTGVGAIAAAALMGTSWTVHKFKSGYANYVATAQPASNLYHSAMPSMGFGSFYNRLTNAGSGVGASFSQMVQAAQILAGTGGTAALSKGNLQAIANGAVGLGYGQSGVTQFASQMSELQRLGLTSGLSASTTNSKLMMLLGNSAVQSGMQGRTQELISALTSLTQTMDTQRATPPNANLLLSMMTTLSKPINGQYLQSTQGQRGANMLASVNNALLSPGGSTAGSVLMYNWLSSRTNMTPYQEQYLAESGLTGRYNGTGPTNLQRLVTGAMRSFPQLASGLTPTGTPSAPQAMALEQLAPVLGLSAHQTQLFLSQFTHNGKFSMASLNAEQNWWQSKFKGMPNASWTMPAAALYNAKSASNIQSIMTTMQSSGVTLNSTETNQLAQLKKLNPNTQQSQYSKIMNSLKTELGSQMMNSTALTSQDANTLAIQQNTDAWTKVSKNLQPFSTFINKAQAAIPGGGGHLAGKAVSPSQARIGIPGNINMSYNPTGYSSMTSQVMNMAFAMALNGGASSNGGGVSNILHNVSYQLGKSGYSTPSVSSAGISQWSQYIKQAAAKYGVPANMIASVMKMESGGQNGLTSSAGAQGLMQIMPFNDKSLGITNPWNAQQNIMGGAKMLSQLYRQFGNWSGALGAYNGGPGNAYGSAEQQYAATVEGFYAAFQKHSPIQVNVNVQSAPSATAGTEPWKQNA